MKEKEKGEEMRVVEINTGKFEAIMGYLDEKRDKFPALPQEEPKESTRHDGLSNPELLGLQFLTIEEISDILQIGRNTILRYIKDGELEAVQLGGKKGAWRIHPTWFKEFLRKKKVHSSAE